MTNVAIIGGGFAGMALALNLQQRDIKSTIYEARDEAYRSGGNIALAPNALRALDHVGVYERIRGQGYNYEELSFTNGQGSTLAKFLNGSKKEYHYKALRIHRIIVNDALRERCLEAGIKTIYGEKCTAVSENEQGVNITFASGDTVTADYVIGADGIHSKVRGYIAPMAEAPRFSGQMGIMGKVMSDELEGISHQFDLPAMLYGDSGFFAIMPSNYSGDEIGYFATIEVDDRSREEWDALGHDTPELKKMLINRFATEDSKWPAFVQALVNKTPTETLTNWPFFSAPTLDSWVSSSDRIILIGDSSHAIPPTGGQGAAMALEDAETLAYTLTEALLPLPNGQQPSLSKLTAAWNEHRHARVAKVVDFTSKSGTLRNSSPHFYEQAAKEWLMWAAFKWTGPEAGLRWMYEYDGESVKATFI